MVDEERREEVERLVGFRLVIIEATAGALPPLAGPDAFERDGHAGPA
jgi:hypothetical protein